MFPLLNAGRGVIERLSLQTRSQPDKELAVGDPVEVFSFSHKLLLWTFPQPNEK